MAYTSTVTSKGTITLPASIRKRLGISEGKKVSIELRGDTIKVRPQAGWEKAFAVGEKLSAQLRQGGGKLPVSDDALKRLIVEVKVKEYREEYAEDTER